MINVRKLNWYIQGFVRKYGTVLLVSSVVGVGLFILVPSLISRFALLKPTSYIGRVGRFPLSRLPRDIQEKVSRGLVRVDESGEALPDLAASYRREEDGKAYRFIIKPNQTWQDGKPITPQDITYSFADIEIARSQNDILYRMSSKKTEENQPEAFMPTSFVSLVSQPLFRQEKSKTLLLRERSTIIGIGEYRITSLIYQGPTIRQLTLESAKDRIVYRFYATEHDAIIAFKQGKVDRLESVQNIEDLSDWRNIGKRLETHTDQYIGVFFNLTYQNGDDQPYANRQLRLALNYALQKPQGNERVLSPIHNKSWAYVSDPSDLDAFEQDMTEAVDNFLKTQRTTPLTISLTTIPSYVGRAEAIKKSWEQLGELAVTACGKASGAQGCENFQITVDIRVANIPDVSNYQVLLVGQQIPADPDQYTLWHSTQQTNFTRYKNARVDKLLEDARKSDNKDERKLLYQEFQRLLVKDSPAIFLEPITTYTVWRRANIL